MVSLPKPVNVWQLWYWAVFFSAGKEYPLYDVGIPYYVHHKGSCFDLVLCLYGLDIPGCYHIHGRPRYMRDDDISHMDRSLCAAILQRL